MIDFIMLDVSVCLSHSLSDLLLMISPSFDVIVFNFALSISLTLGQTANPIKAITRHIFSRLLSLSTFYCLVNYTCIHLSMCIHSSKQQDITPIVAMETMPVWRAWSTCQALAYHHSMPQALLITSRTQH